MSAALPTFPIKCGHPLGLRYIPAPAIETPVRLRLRDRHVLPRYDRHLAHVTRRGKLWLEHSRRRPGNAFARLERAALAANESSFLEALKEVNWQARPVKDFVRATQWALEAGAHLAAREISSRGGVLHPDNPEIQRYARTLAAPKILARTKSVDRGLKANREWLKAHNGEYRGQWVALREGRLLGVDRSVEELVKAVGNTQNVLLTTL
jgi:hypothetical protein